MKIKAIFDNRKFKYTRNKHFFSSEDVSTNDLFQLIKKKRFRWKIILGNLFLFLCVGGFLGYIMDPSSIKSNEESYFMTLLFLGFMGILSKGIGKTKIKYDYSEDHPYPALIEKFQEITKSSYTLNLDNLYEAYGLSGQFTIKPNIILGTKKNDSNLPDYNFLLLPDFLCLNTAGIAGGQNFDKINYKDVTIEYKDTVSIDLASIIAGRKNYLTDTTILSETWLYTNKDGSPDKRRANNPQIPIFEAAEINIKLKDKDEDEKYVWCIISDRKKAREFVDAIGSTLGCQTIIKARSEWEPKHYMAYLLIFIASGVNVSPDDKEKKLLIESLKVIFKLSNSEANATYDLAYSYYISIRNNALLGIDTIQLIISEYFTLLNYLKDGEQKTLETVYHLAYDIANADNEIDAAEQVFLNAMKKEWGVEKSDKLKTVTKNQSSTDNIEEELEKYNSMRDKGLISDKEYETKKKQILDL